MSNTRVETAETTIEQGKAAASAAKAVSPLEWRRYLKHAVLRPVVVGAITGRVSWLARYGKVAENEWHLLAEGQELEVAGGKAVVVFERLHDDALGWSGRQVKFHDTGRLIGPLAIRDEPKPESEPILWRALAQIVWFAGLVAGVSYLLQADVMPSRDHLVFFMIVSASLLITSLVSIGRLLREFFWRRSMKTERFAFPPELDEFVGFKRRRVALDVIEAGYEGR